MSNQDTSDRKDRSGGGDVTKADQVTTPVVPKTQWDLLTNTGPGRTSEE
jgi:hypothetical protein